MSRHGFRFVHATCLCLDEHLVGIGPLSAEDRALAEDATFRAWNGIVDTCIGAQVEFLLLTGNSFNAKTNSLRARVALEKGFEKLAAHDISVFVVPGPLDPLSAWKRSLHLPPNVTLLNDEDHEPVAVMSDQKVLASIYVVATAHSDESKWSAAGPAAFQRHQTPFRIGLVGTGTPVRWEGGEPVALEHHDGGTAAATLLKTAIEHKTDYIALGEGFPLTEYLKSGIAHDPGCAQSLSNEVCGSRGCSVVNVDSTGEVSIDAVAVAPIRWEDIPLHLESHTNQRDLVEKMALTMLEQVPDNDERLWIVTWRVSGEGKLLDSLSEPAAQAELWKQLEAEMTGERAIRRVHRLERGSRKSSEPRQQKAGAAAGSGLLNDFQIILNEGPDALIEEVRRELLELDWMKQNDARFIREAVQHLSRKSLIRRAQTLAGQWLE
ncbi:metallophosphoesterase family protein [Planctomicrobium sp. SH661]|uniref:metallophosphoesterase family protein n=1 Tax=Planctomicrobium sp. SH661 TaxID=3448124 RepID=UPI003F5BEB92